MVELLTILDKTKGSGVNDIQVQSKKKQDKKKKKQAKLTPSPLQCEEVKLSIEGNNPPVVNVCMDGACENENEVCGLGTDIDPLTGSETYKCGCFKDCSKLEPPNCSDGYCHPNECGEVFDTESGLIKCGCKEPIKSD